MSGVHVSRVKLGPNPGPSKNYASGMAGAAISMVPLIFGVISLTKGSSKGLLLLAIGAAVGGVSLAVGVRGSKSRAAAASPATLDAEGFTLQLDGQSLHVPWQQVYKVLIIRHEAGRAKIQTTVVVTSLVAVLYSDAPVRSEPLIERYAQVFESSDAIGLGDITTATRPMDVVLAAVREWIGERLDGNVRDHGIW
ncbi:hypothetical protein AB0L06_35880 [Spirillospora sp. NPDC052269]